jgi:hypothetical protein
MTGCGRVICYQKSSYSRIFHLRYRPIWNMVFVLASI